MSSLSISASSLSYSVFQALTSGGQQSEGASGSATTASTDPLLGTTPAASTASTDPLLAATPTSTTSPADSLLAATSGAAQQAQGGHHHHHGHGGGAFKQIEDAVTNALQSAQADPSTDPNSLIENAIAGVLQNVQGASGQASAGTSAANGNTAAVSAITGNNPVSGADAQDISSSTVNGNSSGQDFAQLLQSLGVTPQQFRTDFLNAIQQAQGGQVNIGTALQSIPSGSVVNALA